MATSAQKSFSQRLTGSHGAEVRRTVSFQTKSESISGCSSSMSLNEMVEPPDWEELSTRIVTERDPLAYPANDVDVSIVPRRIRTIKHVMPEEDLCEVPLHVRECVRCHTSDWVAVDFHYRTFSGSCCTRERLNERHTLMQSVPRQDYEVDIDPHLVSTPSDELALQGYSQPSSGRQSVSSISSVSSCNDTLTPRGSWASLDLRSSSSDALLPDLLERRPPEQLDQLNETRRMDGRKGGLLGLYASYVDDDEAVEKRVQADPPSEVIGHRILVNKLHLKLELEVEPIFACLALYDAKEKKKVSENFYFDMNSELIKQMLSSHVPTCDVSTLSRSAVFDITHPTPDLFLVLRLEKVLQGDITECVEPYIKDDKNRDKVKAGAIAACDRLGKYRMPFAWTAIHLMTIISGSNSVERESSTTSDKDTFSSTSQSNSLDRKSSAGSLEQFRRQGVAGGSLTRRGSLERRALSQHSVVTTNSEELGHCLDTFKPVTVTLNSLFKQDTNHILWECPEINMEWEKLLKTIQLSVGSVRHADLVAESDKLRDEDLYKFLQELRRPSSAMKKLKSIPGKFSLEIMLCPEENENGLTPELAKVSPYADNNTSPCKEILSFPMSPMLVPHYQYRNILYICPKELNFTAFTSRAGSARNIAVRVQLMSGENQTQALNAIFGRSSCPEFTSEAYTIVTYHNKCPTFYDEIKIKLPANLGDQHHLLFTFYHISCQRKPVTAPEQEKNIETPLGYTWLPMCRSGHLSAGEYNLPVMLEPPPQNYSYIFPNVLLPGTKWIDNHRSIFTISLEPFSSVNPMDSQMERFLIACEQIQTGITPAHIINMEAELRNSINELPNAGIEALVKSLPVILDKLILLLVMPPALNDQKLNISQDVFYCLTQIFTNITNMNDRSTCDFHGRSSLLGSYIQFQCLVPRPAKQNPPLSYSHPRSPAGELSSPLQMARNKSGGGGMAHSFTGGNTCKVLHEELSLQWVVASGNTKELAMQNSWILFELMLKSMVEQLWWNGTLEASRKTRFSDQYMDDITTLVTNITSEIISRYGKVNKLTQSLNNSLAFFLFDLLSIVDRGFVFGLIRTYYKQMSAKIASLPDAATLIHYKVAFLRIICSHEHYISLNLPCGTPYTSPTSPSSPSPSTHSSHSTHSTHSHSSNVSYQLSSGDRGCFSELSPEFRHQHYLVGLLLSELDVVLDIQSPVLQGKAVCAVLSLLTSHDSDSRFAQPEVKARVAALYIPLLTIVMGSYSQLYRGFLQGKERFQLGEDPVNNPTSYTGLPSPDASECKLQTPRVQLNSETTRNLLMCFIWVLKSVDKAAITRWCGELPPTKIHTLLQVLSLCFACFEYKGKKEIQRCTQQNVRKNTDIKSKLEDVILGQGSARNEMMMRRKGCHSTMSGEKRERWRKEWVRGGSSGNPPTPIGPLSIHSGAPTLPPTHLEGALAADVSLTVLHTLETIVQVASAWDSHHSLFGLVLRVLLLGLAKNQSTNVLQHMFATQRSLVFKFHWLVFDSETEQCGELCLVLLRHCGALCGAVRAHAAATLYLLMRQNYEIGNNFARVKMQVTMSLSSLVGTSATFSEDSLRRALKTILLYAEQDTDLQETSFPEQVKDLVFNLHMILSDTVKMKEFQEDPEMLLDLMHRIAKGYQNSPDLRLTWLANMAQKHMERSNHTEAGMCLVHSAALVAEYLVLLGSGDGGAVRGGAVALQQVTPNALQESAVSDDVMAPRNEGICLGKDFTEQGLQGLLEHAANSFHTAGMYEAMNDVYKVLIPIAETNRDYKKLANIHGKLNEAYTRIEQLSGKRVFGTYFRVGFYGSKFGDLNGEEFIYKEPTLTKLPEIFSRLENFYSQRFGADNIVIIKDSNQVDTAILSSDKAYIQITYVEPYFEPYELRYRVTHFEKNFNIKRFIYATPFTTSGRAHGELSEQCKRKTVLTTAHHFPYVKTRIQVVHRTTIVLTPIEVAIEDIQKKINELAAATNQEPTDTKMLQMVVQGCIGTTVNQGPMEMALVFLSGVADGTQPPTKLTNKLRLCFKDFSKKCHDALRKNKNLIGIDQKEYQRELEKNYQRFIERLAPLIVMIPGHVTHLSNGSAKTERRFHT